MTHCQKIAQRAVMADEHFLEQVMDRGFTREQAVRIFDEYKRLRVIKRDVVHSRWSVKNGAFWDADVLQRALMQSAAPRRKRR